MNKKFVTILIVCLTMISGISFVSAENETSQSLGNVKPEVGDEEIKNESKRVGEKVTTSDNGYLNISFNDSYNGYCINKGWKGASSGDSFTVKNTSSAVNNNNGGDIGNYLKILFVDFHDDVTRDAKLAQNVIWSFSNDYLNHQYTEYVYKIKEIADGGRVIKDHGESITLNNTTKATFNFEVLSSKGSGYQNFFGYKITYSDITPERLLGAVENTSEVEAESNKTEPMESENTTVNPTSSASDENQSTDENNTNDNNTRNAADTQIKNTTQMKSDNDSVNDTEAFRDNVGLKKHATGISTVILIIAILIVTYIAISKYKKD